VYTGTIWVDAYADGNTFLAKANNLSDLQNTSTARTNLGLAIGTNVQAWDADLDTWATKTAPTGTVVGTSDTQTLTNKTLTSPVVTGGSINNTPIGASTPSTGSFTSLTDSGNLTFTGTGNRILGDFSNATIANRVSFQTSTTNGVTSLGLIPNGSATAANFSAYSNSGVTDAQRAQLACVGGSDVRIVSDFIGSGSFLPLTMFTGGSERLRIDTSGRVGIGLTSPVALLDVNGKVIGRQTLANNGASSFSAFAAGNAQGQLAGMALYPTFVGTGDNGPRRAADVWAGFNGGNWGTQYLAFGVGNAGNDAQDVTPERMRIDASGRLLVGTNTNVGDYKAQIAHSSGELLALRATSGTLTRIAFENAASSFGNTQIIANSTALAFVTGSAERMRINSAGRVGIGRDAGTQNLEVLNSAAVYAASGQTGVISIYSNGQTATELTFGQGTYSVNDNIAFMWNRANAALAFATNNTERMRVEANGNVAIGTTSGASQRLEVNNGSAAITTPLAVANNISGIAIARAGINFNAHGVNFANITGGQQTDNTFGDGTLIFATRSAEVVAERMRIDSSGNLLVGATSQVRSSSVPSVQIANNADQLLIRNTGATAGLHWRYTCDNNNTVYIINHNTNGVYIGNGGTSWLSLSDERHKDIIEPITNAAEKISTLRAVIGKYKKDEEGTRRSFLIAQDVQAVLPEAVFSADPEQLGLSYTDTIPLLVAAIQELKATVDAQAARIAVLESK
jgi:hypothetical protein